MLNSSSAPKRTRNCYHRNENSRCKLSFNEHSFEGTLLSYNLPKTQKKFCWRELITPASRSARGDDSAVLGEHQSRLAVEVGNFGVANGAAQACDVRGLDDGAAFHRGKRRLLPQHRRQAHLVLRQVVGAWAKDGCRPGHEHCCQQHRYHDEAQRILLQRKAPWVSNFPSQILSFPVHACTQH